MEAGCVATAERVLQHSVMLCVLGTRLCRLTEC